jgi:signal transduction histidine kinase
MNPTQKSREELTTLASHLHERRLAILQAWRAAVDADPELTAPDSLPRGQFVDHIPRLLDALELRLPAASPQEGGALEAQRQEDASGHGMQRWQQGYNLREVTREWWHLHLTLVNELESYSLAHPGLDLIVMPTAWRAIAELCGQGVSDSTSQYFKLQKAEAEGHVRDMKQTLDDVRELERWRMEIFRQAAHDLRGNVGVVKNVTWGLTEDDLPPDLRKRFLQLLKRNVTSLHTMLDEVMDLARLQAGRELREVKPFDAAAMLRELGETLQPFAAERGLYLKAGGPSTLPIEGDAIKVRRIAQNLLLNALKYTQHGGVTLNWGDSRDNDPKRWMLCVTDTGPGIHAGPGAPLADAMQEATADARQTEKNASKGSPIPASHSPAAIPDDPRPVHQERGEGIGLSIVKRLSELLDAAVELESKPEVGTVFRIVLPRHYDAD